MENDIIIEETNVSDIIENNEDYYQNNESYYHSNSYEYKYKYISLFFIYFFISLIILQKQVVKKLFSKFMIISSDQKVKYTQVFLISFFNTIASHYVLK